MNISYYNQGYSDGQASVGSGFTIYSQYSVASTESHEGCLYITNSGSIKYIKCDHTLYIVTTEELARVRAYYGYTTQIHSLEHTSNDFLSYEHYTGGYYYYNVSSMPEILIKDREASVPGQNSTLMVSNIQFVF